MPPLPSTIQDETSNLIDTLTRHRKDLLEFQIPRLRGYKGAIATQQQYAAELREDLDRFSRNLTTLEALAEDQERPRDRREVAHRALQFSQNLEQMRNDTRVALLTSKRAIDSLAQSNKHELLRSSGLSQKKSSDEKPGDALMDASNDVTEALHRTIGLMQSELERSVLSSQMLEQSSASLRSTTAAHDILSTLLSTSKHLIISLEKSDWLDRLLILAALAFFFLIVLFILKQRVLDKSIRIAFWWTRFLPDFQGDASLLRAEGGKATDFMATAAVTTLSALASLGPAMASRQPSVSQQSVTDHTFSNIPHSDFTTACADGMQKSSYSTALSNADIPLPTNDDLQDDANTRHQEL